MTRRDLVPYAGLPELGPPLAGLGLVVFGAHRVLSSFGPRILEALLELAAVLLELPQRLSDPGLASWSRP